MEKVLLELTLEEVKTLELLLEVIIYVTKHGELPHTKDIETRDTMLPVGQHPESELKIHHKLGLAKADKLLGKLRKATSHK